MTGSPPAAVAKYDVKVRNLDLSQLVGFPLKIYSKQFPGKELYARVVAAVGQRLVAESSIASDPVYNLVNHQMLILQFFYRGEQISVRARLQKSGGGSCAFELEDTATPLSQRHFYRAKLQYKVNLAPFPATGTAGNRLGRLRWMETSAVNFSAGGALISVPTILHETVRLIINVQQESFRFPSLVLAKVRHGYQHDEISCRAGIEFVTREQANRMFSLQQISEMPRVLFSYDYSRREHLNRAIQELDKTTNEVMNTGVEDENR